MADLPVFDMGDDLSPRRKLAVNALIIVTTWFAVIGFTGTMAAIAYFLTH